MTLYAHLISLKEEVKRSRVVRLLTKPYMDHHLRKVDEAYQATDDSRWLAAQKDVHAGERCFIVGNGPSITMEDLDLIKDEQSFATNSIYRCFSKTQWRPTYYLSVDRAAIAVDGKNIAGLDVPVVLMDRIAHHYLDHKPENLHYLNLHMNGFSLRKYTTANIAFSNHPGKCLYGGYSVTYAAMQLALHMGFKEIYLLGIDHSYAWEVTSNNEIVVRYEQEDHFFKDDGPKGYLYYDGVEHAYELAKKVANERDACIFNATRGGNLEMFDRVDLDDVVKKKHGSGEEDES